MLSVATKIEVTVKEKRGLQKLATWKTMKRATLLHHKTPTIGLSVSVLDVLHELNRVMENCSTMRAAISSSHGPVDGLGVVD